jgi:hypothetical protein
MFTDMGKDRMSYERSKQRIKTEAGLQKRTSIILYKQTPWSESASELYRPSDRRLSGEVSVNFGG